ncbi:MAG: MmgE/PrpD family protein [Desulfuromusa sp.]|nr:MmgE/PrpD family protein [Desulfuromusa sp.]
MTLEKFIHDLSWDEIPEQTRNIARLCTLDAIGCAVAGSRCEKLSDHVNTILKQNPTALDPVWGTHFKLDLPWAIFFNAHITAYFDIDDGHRKAQGHPGATIVPAALATAHHRNLSGKNLLEALIVGYEIAIRAALVMRSLGGPRKGSGGWAITGAAAAVSRLLGCSSEQTVHAIGLAEYYAPQAPQDRSAAFPSEMKEGIAWGAQTGYTAALLASSGFTAMRPHLADSPLVEDLGTNFEIEKTYFKTYACCRWAHPAIDGLKEMLDKQPRPLETIHKIRIRTFDKAGLMARRNPTTTLEAVYSIPYAISCFLIQGRLGPEQIMPAYLQKADVSALSQRVSLLADPELTARFPEQCLQQVEVDFTDGSSYLGPLLSAKGDPDKPYSKAELVDKFRLLTEDILGSKWCLIPELIDELERHSAAKLVSLLSPE